MTVFGTFFLNRPLQYRRNRFRGQCLCVPANSRAAHVETPAARQAYDYEEDPLLSTSHYRFHLTLHEWEKMNNGKWIESVALPMLMCGILAGTHGQAAAASRPHVSSPAGRANGQPPAVPRIAYRHRTLSNGLTVYSIENHRTPTVAIQVWYRVGGKNDPENKSGFAHLFEHLMFKATKNMKSEMMDRLTEYVGGENNAYTTEDRTVYHETVPSNHLETLLWAEADRMANLNVDGPDFVSERAVVEEEFRQSVLAPPYGRLNEFVNARSFLVHPYRRGVIGSIANLDAASLDDVRQFHREFYRPDNATLIVSGDFDPRTLDAWVDRYFGRIPKPEGALPQVKVREPARTESHDFNETGPNVPLPAVVINYLVPAASSEDAPAMRVADVILSSGSSSRLYQSLVYRQQIASSADAGADLRADAGLFAFTTIAAGGKSIADAEKATLAEIDRMKSDPASEAEIEKARNQLIAGALRRRETVAGQASALGEAIFSLGDPEGVNTEIARLRAVTAADIQRLARTYFTPENRVVVRYSAGSQDQGGASKAPSSAITEAPIRIPTETPPLPGAPRRLALPRPVEKMLPNGLRVVTISRPGTGLVSVVAIVRAGGSDDPVSGAGLAEVTTSLLTRGTSTRTATQVSEAVEDLGGTINAGAGWDSSTVALSVMSSRLDAALPVLADVIRHPAFNAEEVTRLRTETLDGLSVSVRSPGYLAQRATERIIFGDGPYGHSLSGTPESIRAITGQDVSQFYRSHYLPRRTVLVIAGDITPSEAAAAAERDFGDWKGDEIATPTPLRLAGLPASPRVIVIDKPDAGQAAVVLTQPGIRRSDPDYAVVRVMNSVLGDGYSSRINQEIRIKRGLSYGASSRFDARRDGGVFTASAQTRNDAAAEVAALLKQEVAGMSAATVPSDELTARKANLAGNYTRRLETGAGLAYAIADLEANELPLSTLATYLKEVQGVNASQVRAIAEKRLNSAQSSIVIVGDGRQFLPALRQKFSDVMVIPISRLDLNSAHLLKP